jgi:hypothetical protein
MLDRPTPPYLPHMTVDSSMPESLRHMHFSGATCLSWHWELALPPISSPQTKAVDFSMRDEVSWLPAHHSPL